MRHAAFLVLVWIACANAAQAQYVSNPNDSEVQRREDARYKEIIITAEVDYEGGLFGGGKQKVTIEGVLVLPDETRFKAPYPLMVSNHGSQSPPSPSNYMAFSNEVPNLRYRTAFFNLRGYAVFYPLRKGFTRKGGPDSKASVNVAEPAYDCKDHSNHPAGLASATKDVDALLKALDKEKLGIDMQRIIMAGVSRGGLLSLSLAAQDYPGIVGVINWVGRWHAEPCSDGSSFNREQFQKLGEKVKLPVLSFYGDRDDGFPLGYIEHHMKLLGQNPKAKVIYLPGESHLTPVLIRHWRSTVNDWMAKELKQ